MDVHGSGYAQMIIPKDGSEPYLHYYDHNYHNLNEISDVSATGGIGQSIDEIWSNLFGSEDLVLPNGEVVKGLGKANPVDIVAAGFQSISYLIHQLKSGNTKFLPTRLKNSMITYFGSFDQVYEGLLNTSIEGFPPGIHGSALTDFKVPLSKLPQETQDMIAKHPLSWTPERIENMTPEQINEQLFPLLETDEQFENYLDFTTDITKMSVEPVHTVPYAVAMQEMDEIYEQYENDLLQKYGEDGWAEFTSGLNRETSEFFAAERAANEDLKTLESEERKELDENNRLRGPQAESDLWDKLVGPYFDALQKITSSGGYYDKNNPTYKKMVKGHTKWKKEVKEMQKEASRIQSEIMDKYRDQREPIENIAYEQLMGLREPVKDSPTGQARWKIVNRDGDASSGADYTALDVALIRNAERSRSVPEPIVTQSWKDVQKNIGKFNNFFKQNFIIVDNNDAKEDIFTAVFKRIVQMAKKKVTNKRAQQWMDMELKRKAEGERGTLGTGRITSTPRQRISPKRAAELEKQYGGMRSFLRRT